MTTPCKNPNPINFYSRRIPVTSKLSPADLEVVQPKATAAGKTLSTYLRDSALGSTVQASAVIPAVNQEQWRELSKAAANLNQLTHRCHTGEDYPASARAQATLDELSQVLSQIRSTLIGGKAGGVN
jgi:hypothetical protein